MRYFQFIIKIDLNTIFQFGFDILKESRFIFSNNSGFNMNHNFEHAKIDKKFIFIFDTPLLIIYFFLKWLMSANFC